METSLVLSPAQTVKMFHKHEKNCYVPAQRRLLKPPQPQQYSQCVCVCVTIPSGQLTKGQDMWN